jgi:hypothetical protein
MPLITSYSVVWHLCVAKHIHIVCDEHSTNCLLVHATTGVLFGLAPQLVPNARHAPCHTHVVTTEGPCTSDVHSSPSVTSVARVAVIFSTRVCA